MRRVSASLLVALIALVACGASAEERVLDSGVRGTVRSGPSCPVVIVGSPCPDRPFVGAVSASDTNGEIARVQTDAHGRFRMPLAPGHYTLVAVVAGGGPPTAKPETVRVRVGRFTRVTLTVDTAIR
jgi:carboxypeptidase family protein